LFGFVIFFDLLLTEIIFTNNIFNIIRYFNEIYYLGNILRASFNCVSIYLLEAFFFNQL